MSAPYRAGAIYFALVFAAGFVLGALRTIFVAPALGATGAVLLELPVMLALSWLACGFALKLVPVEPAVVPRLTMGFAALALLLAGEAMVSVFLAGLSLAEHFTLYRTAPVLVGLLGQIVFTLFPAFQR